jgi:hypothetical protein
MSPPPPRHYVPPDDGYGRAVVDVTGLGEEAESGLGDVSGLADAIRSARDAGMTCYLTENGVSVAAIVPVWAAS